MGKICSTNTDIFLFNLPRGEYLGTEQYKILESIKDGAAVDSKYNSQKLYFKKPNVLIVFANDEPKRAKLSKDRWVILKISNDLTELVDIYTPMGYKIGVYLSYKRRHNKIYA